MIILYFKLGGRDIQSLSALQGLFRYLGTLSAASQRASGALGQ